MATRVLVRGPRQWPIMTSSFDITRLSHPSWRTVWPFTAAMTLLNLISDTLTEGGGLHLGNRFGAVPLSGRISLKGNMVVRGGSFDPRWHIAVGAVWLYALDTPLQALLDLQATPLVDTSRPPALPI